MFVSTIFLITTIICCTTTISTNQHWIKFVHFQNKFNKHYANVTELEHRFSIFQKNILHIIQHNANTSNSFILGINQFSDLTQQEFKTTFASGYISYKQTIVPTFTPTTFYPSYSSTSTYPSTYPSTSSFRKTTTYDNFDSYGCKLFSIQHTSNAESLPIIMDWRELGAVTKVKDQGQCGSCWTFSATGAVEGAWYISTDQLIDLSEQELVDCATGAVYGSQGCNGGQMEGAYKFIIKYGQCSYTDYPYTEHDEKCKKCEQIVSISSCYDVTPNDQLALTTAVSKQPVAVAIEADSRYFQSYTGGILDAESCGTNLDHGVLIVGYGEEQGKKYYIVKNSWGDTWGENGYIRIARSDKQNDAGICGIAMSASFPNV